MLDELTKVVIDHSHPFLHLTLTELAMHALVGALATPRLHIKDATERLSNLMKRSPDLAPISLRNWPVAVLILVMRYVPKAGQVLILLGLRSSRTMWWRRARESSTALL